MDHQLEFELEICTAEVKLRNGAKETEVHHYTVSSRQSDPAADNEKGPCDQNHEAETEVGKVGGPQYSEMSLAAAEGAAAALPYCLADWFAEETREIGFRDPQEAGDWRRQMPHRVGKRT